MELGQQARHQRSRRHHQQVKHPWCSNESLPAGGPLACRARACANAPDSRPAARGQGPGARRNGGGVSITPLHAEPNGTLMAHEFACGLRRLASRRLLPYQGDDPGDCPGRDGRVVTGGADDRVRMWDVQSSSPGGLLVCFAYAPLPPSPHLKLASSSVTHGAAFHAGRYVQRHRTCLGLGNVRECNCINRRGCSQGPRVDAGLTRLDVCWDRGASYVVEDFDNNVDV